MTFPYEMIDDSRECNLFNLMLFYLIALITFVQVRPQIIDVLS